MNAEKIRLVCLLSFALPLAAQPEPPQASQHGLRAGSQLAYLSGGDGSIDCNRTLRGPSAFFAEFELWVERLPADFAESVIGGCDGSREGPSRVSFQRFVRDNFRKVYVGYEMTVETLPEKGSYRVTFGESHMELPAEAKKPGWKVAAPPRYPAPQIVESGDEIPLPLYTTDTGVQLVDYIHLGALDTLRKRADAARDSYAEDAEFTLARPKLRVNGAPGPSAILPETLRGPVLWLYVPGEGRYVVSFVPHRDFGFAKTGEVAGGLMTLTVGRNLLRIASSDRIAPGGGVYNVYGALDPNWMPADPKDRDRFEAGTSPAAETAIGRAILQSP